MKKRSWLVDDPTSIKKGTYLVVGSKIVSTEPAPA
jgi:hypothetical protein